jgi:hypothetical protein
MNKELTEQHDAPEFNTDCGHEAQFPLLFDKKTWCDECLAQEFEEEIMDVALETFADVERAEEAACNTAFFSSDRDQTPCSVYIGTPRPVRVGFSALIDAREMRKLKAAQETARKRGWTPDKWAKVAEIVKDTAEVFHADMEHQEAGR